jgi:hypothetical protein
MRAQNKNEHRQKHRLEHSLCLARIWIVWRSVFVFLEIVGFLRVGSLNSIWLSPSRSAPTGWGLIQGTIAGPLPNGRVTPIGLIHYVFCSNPSVHVDSDRDNKSQQSVGCPQNDLARVFPK